MTVAEPLMRAAILAAAYAERCVQVTGTGGANRRYIAIVSPTGVTALMDEPYAGVRQDVENQAKSAIREMLLAFAADLHRAQEAD